MMIALLVLALILFTALAMAGFKIQKLQKEAVQCNENLSALRQECDSIRTHYEAEANRIHQESTEAIGHANILLEEKIKEFQGESEQVRQHYESEARKAQEAAEEMVTKTLKDLQPLRKYESMGNAEEEVKTIVARALAVAADLRKEAQDLLSHSRAAASEERSKGIQRAKELQEQAEAVLSQATKDAGRMVEEAHKRAEQIGGDAYRALQDKQLLERAVIAIKNVVAGYGDRYVVPGRNLLDDLAEEFGHTAAGETLKAARQQSKRMVEEGEAASCDYAEPGRRETAIRFVVDAFNGRVDAVLSRVKHDNYGTLEQEIRDAFALVNLNGNAFRNAQVLLVYLEARLAELKWAVVVQEFRLKEREEQRRVQEQMREEEKLRREVDRTMRESAKEQEIIKQAMQKAQQQVQHATEEQRLNYEQQLRELGEKLKEAQERGQRAISQAQQTKLGHVYVISNIGSFGEKMFKIGMTRRLVPQDRIDELGDSSVPFEFDVHAFIRCDDAPALEHKLHNHFVMGQVNKVNHRKEFFRVDLKHIREEIEKMGISAQWTMTSQSAEYRETLAIEEAIKKNPALRDSWVKRQLQLETLDEQLDEIVPEAASPASTN
jgi:hypothetical protein